jgi:hypothetical protein
MAGRVRLTLETTSQDGRDGKRVVPRGLSDRGERKTSLTVGSTKTANTPTDTALGMAQINTNFDSPLVDFRTFDRP